MELCMSKIPFGPEGLWQSPTLSTATQHCPKCPTRVMRQRQEEKKGTTCSGYCCRCCSAEVTDLEHQPHGGVERDPLITGQSQHLAGQKTQCVKTSLRDNVLLT